MSAEHQATVNINKSEETTYNGPEQADDVAINNENQKKANQKPADIVTTAQNQNSSYLKENKELHFEETCNVKSNSENQVQESSGSKPNEDGCKTVEDSNETNETSNLDAANESSNDVEPDPGSLPEVLDLNASDTEDDDSDDRIYWEESSEASLYERLRNQLIMASDDDTDAESLPEFESNEFFDWICERNEYRENNSRDLL